MVLAVHLDDAHPAGAEARQFGFVAQRRDLDPVVAADLEDRLAGLAFDGSAIHLEPECRRRKRPLGGLRGDQPLLR